jgi:hypothetical protein
MLQGESVRGAVREAVAYILEDEAVCTRFTRDVKQYISHFKGIHLQLEKAEEQLEKAEEQLETSQGCCSFMYPPDSRQSVDFGCVTLRRLEDGAFIDDCVIMLFSV